MLFPSFKKAAFSAILLCYALLHAQETVPSWFLNRTVYYQGHTITIDSFLTLRRAHHQMVVFIFDNVLNLEDHPRLMNKAARILRGFGERASVRTDRIKVFFYLFVDPPDSVLIKEYFRKKKIARGVTLIDIAPTFNNPLVNTWNITEYPFYLAFNYRKEIIYMGTDRHDLIRRLAQ